MSTRIPTSITQDEFNEATKPLFDLLGTSGMEIVGDIHIVMTPTGSLHHHEIRFSVVATPDSSVLVPDAVQVEGHPQGDEFAIWSHAINVAVL